MAEVRNNHVVCTMLHYTALTKSKSLISYSTPMRMATMTMTTVTMKVITTVTMKVMTMIKDEGDATEVDSRIMVDIAFF
jgi:hypothetical protein